MTCREDSMNPVDRNLDEWLIARETVMTQQGLERSKPEKPGNRYQTISQVQIFTGRRRRRPS